MKIKLLQDLPIGKEHKAFKGNVYEVIRIDENGRDTKYFFKGAASVECAAFDREVEFIEDDEFLSSHYSEDERDV